MVNGIFHANSSKHEPELIRHVLALNALLMISMSRRVDLKSAGSIVHRKRLSGTLYATVILGIIMLLCFPCNAQYCEFDHRVKSGGNYFFATYYTGFDHKTTREDTCERVINGVLIEHHVFHDGIMLEEVLYQWDTQKPYQEFHRVQQDSVIGVFVHYDYEGRITNKRTFYNSSEGKRCYEEAIFQNGLLSNISYFQFIHVEELKQLGFADFMEIKADNEGYTEYTSQYGTETTFHNNGQIASIKRHRYIVHSGIQYEKTQHGEYAYYDDYGILRAEGQYDQGKANGVFHYYHANGKVAEIKEFDHDRSIGVWRGFDEHGNPHYVSTYSDEFWPGTPHERIYSSDGSLKYERVIYSNGSGFQSTFFQNGLLQERLEYTVGPQYPSSTWRYYESGLLKQKSFIQPRQDTVSAEFFEDGSIYRLNLYDSKEIQESWEYYSPGKLMKHSYTRQSPTGISQSFQEYHENGILKWEMALNDEFRTDKHYWASGILKELKEQKSNILHGSWIVFDTTGIEIKNCQYQEGIRIGNCSILHYQNAEPVSKSEWRKLRAIVMDRNACNYFQSFGPDVYTKKHLDEETEVLSKIWAFLKAHHCDWTLADRTGDADYFEYILNFPDTIIRDHRDEIDSVLRSLHMRLDGSWKSPGGGFLGRYQCDDLHSSKSLNSAFENILTETGQYFELINRCIRIDYDMSDVPYSDSFIYHIEKLNSGHKVSISNGNWSNTFVIYDDGYIELYNGVGNLDCDDHLIERNEKD